MVSRLKERLCKDYQSELQSKRDYIISFKAELNPLNIQNGLLSLLDTFPNA